MMLKLRPLLKSTNRLQISLIKKEKISPFFPNSFAISPQKPKILNFRAFASGKKQPEQEDLGTSLRKIWAAAKTFSFKDLDRFQKAQLALLLTFSLSYGFFILYFLTPKDDDELPTPTIKTLPKNLHIQLQGLLGDRYKYDKPTVEGFGKDQRSFHTPASPKAVVFPNSQEEIQEILKICNKYRVPIIPYGGGTSLEGHINAYSGGISISFQNLNKIVAINEKDLDCVVQPGITYDELNEQLEKYNLFFAVDPGPGATIGGMISTSGSGTNAVRYGTIKENILNVTVVIPSGLVVKTGNRARKSSAGYDLTHLFVGAEGTLGVVTQATLKLQRIPEQKAIAMVPFNSIREAADAVIETVQRGIQVGKVELLDEVCLKSVNLYNGTKLKETPTLFFELSGSKANVEDQLKKIEAITKKNKGGNMQFATNKEERDKLWSARKTALWAAPSLKPGAEVKITDVCVPISKLADCIEETKEDLKKSTIPAPLVGHVGDGNFHLFMLVNPKNESEVEEAERLDSRLVNRAIQMDGTCTGEHGIGIGKKQWLLKEKGPDTIQMMKKIKKSFDPRNIMNPGKIF